MIRPAVNECIWTGSDDEEKDGNLMGRYQTYMLARKSLENFTMVPGPPSYWRDSRLRAWLTLSST